jgi:hypothetical protein
MQCSVCGAELPENARFCLNCGAPTTPPQTPPRPAAPLPELDFIQPALAGGMFLGVLSSLPIIGVGNCICCMWVVGGGAFAAFLLMKQRPAGGIAYGDGAFAGVMSGLFGAVVATIISIPMKVLMARFLTPQQDALERAMQDAGIEGPMKDLMLRMASSEITVPTVLFTFITYLLVFALFAMIGGILMVAIVNKQKTPRNVAPS